MTNLDCLPKELFVPKEYLNQLTCMFGLGIFKNPVALPCQHVFCQSCIEMWLDKHGTCPKCRQKYSKGELKPQWIIANIIKQAAVACPNSGCCWTGRYDMLEQHQLTECKEANCPCAFGCGEKIKRSSQEEHNKVCELRRVACNYCKSLVLFKKVEEHEHCCIKNVIQCPQCSKELLWRDLELHQREECDKAEIKCKFANIAQCEFKGTKEKLEEHYINGMESHIELLTSVVYGLQVKIEGYEKIRYQYQIPCMNGTSLICSPTTMPKNSFDINWSNGDKKANGSIPKAWSVILTNKSIPGNFRARIKILELNSTDQNGWKICVGIFNSPKIQAGNWGRFKNSWGYVLGTGQKAGTESHPYGEIYKAGDIITIEYNAGKITFFKNDVSQGEAFNGIRGPFYLGAAISDTGHIIEILDVVLQ